MGAERAPFEGCRPSERAVEVDALETPGLIGPGLGARGRVLGLEGLQRRLEPGLAHPALVEPEVFAEPEHGIPLGWTHRPEDAGRGRCGVPAIAIQADVEHPDRRVGRVEEHEGEVRLDATREYRTHPRPAVRHGGWDGRRTHEREQLRGLCRVERRAGGAHVAAERAVGVEHLAAARQQIPFGTGGE